MRRIGITISLVALLLGPLALPGSASAGHLSRADFKSVSKYCKALRAEMGTRSFKRAFGKGKQRRLAQRRCVARRGALPKEKVSLRSQAPPAGECPPGTQPEPPQPVSAFAVTPTVCVALPPLPLPAGEDSEGDDSEESDAGTDDQDDDDDREDEDGENGESGRDEGDDEHDSDDD